MKNPNRILFPLIAALIAAPVFISTPADAATMSASPTAPVVNGLDIANLVTPTGTDKWFAENSGAGAVKGQTFTTGSTPVLLKSITYQTSSIAIATKTYVIRIGTLSGTTFTQIGSETATQTFTWNPGEYMTWTLATPVLLSANTTYAIDVGMTNSTSGWATGIPYLNQSGNVYAGGVRYASGTSGVGTTTMSLDSGKDRIFHLELQHPMAPSPDSGSSVPAGDVVLSWTNMTPTTGTAVWVDVWFGTNPAALTKVANGQLNLTTFTVNAPGANTYYWRIDSYLNGSPPPGTPVQGSLFNFIVFDSDGDGFPDAYELAHTTPPSATALNREDDRDTDGITNWNEFQSGTNPSLADTDGDGLLDGDNITVTSGDPRYAAWATAGTLFTDAGGQRTFRSENAVGADPLKADTDADGLPDGVETNTGTWVSASNTGTSPTNPDTDGDALKDGVETKTGVFVSTTNTGTNPHSPDTDNDGAGDWYEVTASFTDPFLATSKPNIPYPLPDPDASTGVTDKPVKVYVMSGQSNMLGFGTTSGAGDGTLETMTARQNKFPNLITETGAWTTRQDVRYRGVISDIANVQLSPGTLGSTFGPELGFGYIMGWLHDEPVLLLKASIGNRSLGWDVLPPGSPSYQYGGSHYAGYGQTPLNWTIGNPTTPWVSGNWYAGKQYDEYFLHESQWAHPGTGGTNVVDILDAWVGQYGAAGKPFAGHDFEIAGFVWWQGDKDRYDMGHATRYEQNLVNLINSLRSYYTNRYPGKVVNNAPFVLATLGQTPMDSTNAADKAILDAQLAVDGAFGKYPQFAGNVKTVYSYPLSEEGASNSHYNGRAGTYMLVGDALGRAMVDLESTGTPGSAYATWAAGPFSGTLTNSDPTLDFDNGGLDSGIEWVVGGDPTLGSDDVGKAPVFDNTTDPDYFIFTYRRSAAANAAANITIAVKYSSNLSGWNTAAHDGTNIIITPTPNGAGPGIDSVQVKIKRTLAANGKLFARLRVETAP